MKRNEPESGFSEVLLSSTCMARAPASEKASPDIDAINLGRVLSRLEHKILSDADPRLRTSSYERTKTSAVSFRAVCPSKI